MPPPLARRPAAKGVWFPVLLGVLIVLLLPGVVLLLLALFDRQGAVNGWLQQHLGLTYNLPFPWWAILALLFIPILLVLLYFLKLRRKAQPVPSTFLWKKSIEDLHVNSLFQWLRDNMLLLVQLLTLLLLIYAVLAIQLHVDRTAGKHYILVIDNSASMGVEDADGSRLEAAKREALKEIDAHGDDDFGMVIAFNSRASLLQPYTSDRTLLRRAVQRIAPTQRPTRVDEALGLADSLANPIRSTDDAAVRPAGEDPTQRRTYVPAEGVHAEVHLFSDGRFPDVPEFTAGNLDLRFHRAGTPGPEAVDNVGIVSCNARRDEKTPGRLKVLVQVMNFRREQVPVRVRLESRIDGELKDTRTSEPLTLPARVTRPAVPERSEPAADNPGEQAFVFDLDAGETADLVLHAQLLDAGDRFPLDDEAWLAVGVPRKARIALVTPGNEILSNFFDTEAMRKVANVTFLKPADLKDAAKYGRPARDGAFDLIVFDRCAPDAEDALPLSNTFFIDAVPPPWKRADLPPLRDAQIRNPTSKHPVMRHLTGLDEIAFSGAFQFDLRDPRVPAKSPRLLETGRDTAVLFALQRRAFTDLVLAFPLINDKGEWSTNWYQKLSLPIFLWNVTHELGHVSDSAAEENVQPGEVKVVRPDEAVAEIDVLDPGGTKHTVEHGTQADFLFKDTDRVGPYRARWAGGRRDFAVNLLDPEESNVQPRDEVRIGSQTVVSGEARPQPRDLWKWIALGALALLFVEWGLYNRRVGG